ncbi:hypothetical protein KSS87_015533, partial [Heliosperma pusillum]
MFQLFSQHGKTPGHKLLTHQPDTSNHSIIWQNVDPESNILNSYVENVCGNTQIVPNLSALPS